MVYSMAILKAKIPSQDLIARCKQSHGLCGLH